MISEGNIRLDISDEFVRHLKKVTPNFGACEQDDAAETSFYCCRKTQFAARE